MKILFFCSNCCRGKNQVQWATISLHHRLFQSHGGVTGNGKKQAKPVKNRPRTLMSNGVDQTVSNELISDRSGRLCLKG